jgi:hypothetical protein
LIVDFVKVFPNELLKEVKSLEIGASGGEDVEGGQFSEATLVETADSLFLSQAGGVLDLVGKDIVDFFEIEILAVVIRL